MRAGPINLLNRASRAAAARHCQSARGAFTLI